SIFISDTKINDDYKPILRGKDVYRYSYKESNKFIYYGNHLACPRRKEIFEQPKILIREAGSVITATYDDSNFYIMSSLYNAISKDKGFNLKYLLVLINSQLFQFLMNQFTFEKTKGAFTKAKIYHYYNLPVKIIQNQNPFIELVDQILLLKKENPQSDTTALEQQIDNLVYRLYDLTYDEVKVVDPAFALSEEEYNNIEIE
ncbi:MAG TPA: TaqI-like C-terminal specificity domain-containing protein, partial [Paludibacteraceae bacterium]|nr:TaqI-like C-terminal specificity domain-containing protein [Paludibacteraceae bacterium]